MVVDKEFASEVQSGVDQERELPASTAAHQAGPCSPGRIHSKGAQQCAMRG